MPDKCPPFIQTLFFWGGGVEGGVVLPLTGKLLNWGSVTIQQAKHSPDM